MNGITGLAGRAALVLLAVIALQQFASHAMTEGLQSLIDSQPPPVKASPATPIVGWANCDLHIQTDLNDSYYRPPHPCEIAGPKVVLPTVSPDASMTPGASEQVMTWFLIAAIGIPLTFGGAILGAYWIARRD